MARYRKSGDRGNVFHIRDRFEDLKTGLKDGLMSVCLRCGVEAFAQMLNEEAEAMAGPKGKQIQNRQAHHWGKAPAEVVLGGGKIKIDRPRVRTIDKRELALPSFVIASREDLLRETMMEGIICGLSTRSYGDFVEKTQERRDRATSKSSVSRRIVQGTSKRLEELLGRSLSELDLLVMMMDGVSVGDHTILIALGIDRSGQKHVLGLREGSTENAAVATALLNDLRERGLVFRPCLVVLDGGKGIRKAVIDVMGESTPIQRCRIHKGRNILDHLPREKRAWVRRLIQKAWNLDSEEEAKNAMLSLATALERDYPGAAASVREGLGDLFTVKRLGLRGPLAASLSSTNFIESLIGRGRAITGKVKRWRGGTMALRWMATAILEAEKGFRRIRGARELPFLEAQLGRNDSLLCTEKTA